MFVNESGTSLHEGISRAVYLTDGLTCLGQNFGAAVCRRLNSKALKNAMNHGASASKLRVKPAGGATGRPRSRRS